MALPRPLRPREEVVLTITDTVSNEAEQLPYGPDVTEELLGRSVKSLIVLLALLGAVQSAKAQVSGNDLYEKCKASQGPGWDVKRALCMGYIEGVFDAISSHYLCRLEGVTIGQLVDIVSQYLSARSRSRTAR
jgi:hypothetical protein